MRSLNTVFALFIATGCTSPSAPSGQLEPDMNGDDTEQECPANTEPVGGECAEADDTSDAGPRRVPVLGSGGSQSDTGVTVGTQDAGRDAALDAGDAGRGNMASDTGTAGSMESGAKDSGSDGAAGDATGVDPGTTCAERTSRLAFKGDDEFSYTGPGWIADSFSLIPGSFAADDAGVMRRAEFQYSSGSREPMLLSARNLDAGFAPGVYMASVLDLPGRPTFLLGDVSVCADTSLEIVEVEVSPPDVDASKPAQLRKLYARFDRRCYDGTRYNFLVGCFRYVAP